MNRFILSTVLFTFASSVFATNMKAPISLPTAKTLPKGVRNINLKGVFASASEKYNTYGNPVGLSDPMYTNVTFGDLIIGKDDGFDKAGIISKMQLVGATEETILGETTGDINVKPTVTVPVFAWGITNKWTAAIAVPIMKYSLNVDSGIRQTNADIYNKVQTELMNDGLHAEREELNRKFAAPLQAKVIEYGYKPLANEEGTKLGDIALVNRLKAWEDKNNALTLTGAIVLPTGKELDPNKIVDVPGGDGQTDIVVGLNHDFYFAKYFTFSSGLSYTAQLSDTVERRVPIQRKSTVSKDRDNNIDRNLGDITTAQMASNVNYRGYSFGMGYTFSYKSGDKYTGDIYEQTRYDWLGKDSVQNMQALTAKIGYDTITLFKEGKFIAPLAISLTHTRVLDGKNMVNDPLTVLDFNMFF